MLFSLAAAEPKVETVLDKLADPFGLAIQPETATPFVAESGAGRILRAVDGRAEEVITGSKKHPFESISYRTQTPRELGPLGLAFFDRETLLVGDGGYGKGEDCVRAFSLPAAGKTIAYEECKWKLGPLSALANHPSDGKFYSLAISSAALFVTCHEDPATAWVARADINGTKFGVLERFVRTNSKPVDAPRAITIGPQGEIVVGQHLATKSSDATLIRFFSAHSGKELLSVPTKLHEITGLAYHPNTGLLYAVDLAVREPAAAGLYRIDRTIENGKTQAQAIKIIALEHPTALAFAPDGTLFITTLGPLQSPATPQGKLLKITLP
jgi:glucose/arabinose dehydrogenase